MKNLFEVIMQAAKELEHKKLLKFLEDNANEATDNVFDLAADLYTEQSNSHKQVVSGKRPLDSAKYVCEWYSDWFKRREENKDELFGTDEILNTHSQTFLEFYQAACASGAVDKTVSVDKCQCYKPEHYSTCGINCDKKWKQNRA